MQTTRRNWHRTRPCAPSSPSRRLCLPSPPRHLPLCQLPTSPLSPTTVHPLTTATFAASMLELQLPVPHALPRELPFDFYSTSRPASKMDAARQMQLPMPQIPNGHDLDSLRNVRRPPFTPPSDTIASAVRGMSLPPSRGASQDFGYQLPAIGNSRTVTTRSSPTAQRQPQHQAQQPAQSQTQAQQTQSQSQDMSQRKKWNISPNLRVPSSIDTPQEGLPQLAAEVSIFRWVHRQR